MGMICTVNTGKFSNQTKALPPPRRSSARTPAPAGWQPAVARSNRIEPRENSHLRCSDSSRGFSILYSRFAGGRAACLRKARRAQAFVLRSVGFRIWRARPAGGLPEPGGGEGTDDQSSQRACAVVMESFSTTSIGNIDRNQNAVVKFLSVILFPIITMIIHRFCRHISL